ncbi:hypothetical protein AB0392_10570 [Nonomuraea angiospora]|uniref:hypothetical protein n=1 Tax=Nonomuraea angiospora TaxID=46172 RepID=UPI00344F7B86
MKNSKKALVVATAITTSLLVAEIGAAQAASAATERHRTGEAIVTTQDLVGAIQAGVERERARGELPSPLCGGRS